MDIREQILNLFKTQPGNYSSWDIQKSTQLPIDDIWDVLPTLLVENKLKFSWARRYELVENEKH